MSIARPGTATAADERRLVRWRRFGAAAFWVFFFGYPVSDLVRRHLGTAVTVLAACGLTALAAIFIYLCWAGWARHAPLRRLAPWMIVQTVLALTLAFGLGGQFTATLYWVSAASGMFLPLAWVPWAVVGAALAATAAAVPGFPGGPVQVTLTAFLIVATGMMPAIYRHALALITELRRAREDLARLAVTEERLRFARDLHDLLGHTLSAISLKTQVARRIVRSDPDGSERQLDEIGRITQRALTDVRDAVTGYRATALADELDTARSLLGTAGVDLTVHTSGTPLPAEAARLFAWVVREAVTNVLRHAEAATCAITVRHTADGAVLEISDDGAGPPRPGAVTGNGLAGLAERLTASGGSLDTAAPEGGGFRVTARLPAPAPAVQGTP